MKAKILILITFVSQTLYAGQVYKMPSDNSRSGYVEVEDTDRGLVVRYPKGIQVTKLSQFHGDIGLTEKRCQSSIASDIDSALREGRELTEQDLYTKHESLITIEVFPFGKQSFFDELHSFLSDEGVETRNYRYPVNIPEFSAIRFINRGGSISSKLPTKVGDVVLARYSGHRLHMSTKYIPAICDLMTKKLEIQIPWKAELYPHNREYKETMTKEQVSEIYQQSKNNVRFLDSIPRSFSKDEKLFLQGAIIGSEFERSVDKITAANLKTFVDYTRSLIDAFTGKFKVLSANDLKRIYYDLQIDVTKPVKYEGVTYAN